ncbi:MAG TPA: UvrB/UvrC motif-containing protein, partial [Actinomycetota bacterium]
RRQIQLRYNVEHGIDPTTVQRKVTDILLTLRGEGDPKATAPTKPRRQRASARPEMPTEELERLVLGLEEEMHQAAKDLRFEYAARLRDEVHDLKRELKQLREAGVA